MFGNIEESLRQNNGVEDLNDDEIMESCILSNMLKSVRDHSNTQSVKFRVACSEVGTPWKFRSGFDRCKSQRNNVGLQS